MLPQPPSQGGVLRGMALLVLVFALLAAGGIGTWMIRDQLVGVWNMAYTPPRVSQGISVEGMVAYIAPTSDGNDNLFVRTGTTVKQITDCRLGRARPSPRSRRIASASSMLSM